MRKKINTSSVFQTIIETCFILIVFYDTILITYVAFATKFTNTEFDFLFELKNIIKETLLNLI